MATVLSMTRFEAALLSRDPGSHSPALYFPVEKRTRVEHFAGSAASPRSLQLRLPASRQQQQRRRKLCSDPRRPGESSHLPSRWMAAPRRDR